MPQGDYIELAQKRFGRRFDADEKERKRAARAAKSRAEFAQKVTGLRAKLYNKKRFAEKVELKKTLRLHEEKTKKLDEPADDDGVASGALPHYLLDRKEVSRAKVLSNMVKQKRKEKAGKWTVPLPKVRPISEDEMFTVIKTGKRKSKQWKRRITKITFVPPTFTRKPPKFERFIRPTGLRMKKAHVTHPELKSTFQLDIIGVKKNPSSQLFTQLGVITKGTIIEVNVSELGLVTQTGKVVWAKYAQVTNNPENDGLINAVLLV
jgi:ribosome biogenesis protein NSA2